MAVRTAIAERDAAPIGWEGCQLSDDVTLISGQHIMARHVNTRGVGMPYLTGPADFPDGVISQTKFTTHPSKVCRADDILVTVKGSGSGTLVRADAAYCISRQLMSIRPTRWDTSFLYYSLLQNAGRIKEASTGLIPGLSRSDILGQRIPVPSSRAEQWRIAASLRDADDLISVLERLIAKKQAIKQGMMQQLLTGQIRLPGFTEPWKSRALGTILRFQVGYPFSSSGFSTVPEGPRLIRNRDLKANDAVVYFARPFPDGFTVNDGDVLIGMDGDFTPCRWRQGKALLNQRVGRLVGQNGCCTEYLFYALRAPLKAIEAETGATTVKHLSHTDVERIELTLPGLEEQQAIARVLAEVDDELETIRRRMTKARALKQGMMQELLTGRTRLPVKEPAV